MKRAQSFCRICGNSRYHKCQCKSEKEMRKIIYKLIFGYLLTVEVSENKAALGIDRRQYPRFLKVLKKQIEVYERKILGGDNSGCELIGEAKQ